MAVELIGYAAEDVEAEVLPDEDLAVEVEHVEVPGEGEGEEEEEGRRRRARGGGGEGWGRWRGEARRVRKRVPLAADLLMRAMAKPVQ